VAEAADAHRQGNLAVAERTYRAILRDDPGNAEVLHLLGLMQAQRGETALALETLSRALAIAPNLAAAHCTLGDIAAQGGDLAGAETHYRRALAADAGLGPAHTGLAAVLLRAGRASEAADAMSAAVRLAPRDPATRGLLLRALRIAGRVDAWLQAAVAATQAFPEDAALATELAEARFAAGDDAAGWRALARATASPPLPLPPWDGRDPAAAMLVALPDNPEDAVLQVQLLADLAPRIPNAVIRCAPGLGALLRRSFPRLRVIDRAPAAAERTGCAFATTLADLAAVLRPESPAAAHASLHADADLTRRLRDTYRGDDATRLLVGIAWRSDDSVYGRDRSVDLALWGPVLNVPGVTFVSLQPGDHAAAIAAVRKGFNAAVVSDAALDPGRELDRFAAQIAAMDLVVAADTATAHLAGALGVPTLCLVPPQGAPGDRALWRERDGRSTWYPSVRLLRRPAAGTWLSALREAGLAVLDAAAAAGAAVDLAGHLRALAKAFTDGGMTADAEAVLGRLATVPGCAAEALCALGGLAKRQGDAERALSLYDRAIAADASYWRAYNDKGVLLGALHRYPEALQAYDAARALNPDSGEIRNNLGTALRALGRSAEALAHYEYALEVLAERDPIQLNAAAVLDDLGRTDEALARLDAFIAKHPDHVDAHDNKAITLLSAGRLAEGWREFPWRLRQPTANVRYDSFPVPRWDGESLAGQSVLIWTEQGIGDEIMTASMIPDALAAAGHVTVLCSERLVPLFRRSFPAARVAVRAEPLPAFVTDGSIAYQLSQSELGRLFRPDLAAFPGRRRFLEADGARTAALRARYLERAPDRRLVGLSWRSPKNPRIGVLKSMELLDWAPILRVPGLTFVNLQYGDCAAEFAQAARELGVEIIDDAEIDPLRDMDGFAAQVAALDLVVSVSNTTVHTAGALGVPTLALIAEGRGRIWYWFRDRAECAWYPSVRLLRQRAAADWTPVIAAAAEAVAQFTTPAGGGQAAAPSMERTSVPPS
jgi:tetratricopeptide (TPR) repeat protein